MKFLSLLTESRFSQSLLMAAVAIALPLRLAQPVHAQDEKAFLWTVESDTNTVYLLGSVHLLRPSDYPLPSPIQAAFDDAEYLVFEVNFDELNSVSTQTLLLEAAQPETPQEAFQSALSPATYQLAEEAVTDVGLPISMFDRFEPWFFSVLLPSVHLLQMGFNPLYGVDPYFFNAAQEAGKPISALETVDEQISFFDDLSIETQVSLVEQTVLELDTFETSFNTLVDAWRSGDVETFTPMILESFDTYPEVYDVLLRQRNQRWLPTIESLINQPQDYLVVVGAAHLVGPDSLIQLLRANEYVVEQVGQD
ncbi:MAG: TraB/GumN family protein [Leptolyngbyaceae bacterium]|nr:TraB/GumN family protein [Leptolyngbyaceae bacterium]